MMLLFQTAKKNVLVSKMRKSGNTVERVLFAHALFSRFSNFFENPKSKTARKLYFTDDEEQIKQKAWK